MAYTPRKPRWTTVSVVGLGLVMGLLTGCGQADGGKQAQPDPMDSLDRDPVPAAAGNCEAELLEWPSSDFRDGTIKVSPDGAYAAAAVRGTGDFVLWHEGEAKVVSAMDNPGAGIRLDGVNSHGVVIGQDFGEDAGESPRFAWDATTGKLRELRGGDGFAELAGINDAGTIVQAEQRIDDEPFYGNDLHVWSKGSDKGEPLTLDSKKHRAPLVSAISNEGMLAGGLFDGESVELGGEYDFLPRLWKPDGEAVEVPVEEWDANAFDLAGGWVIVSAETNDYRWKFTTDEKPVKLDGFNAATVDEPGRVYGSIGAEADEVPAVFDARAHELPVPADATTAPRDPTDYPVPNTVTDASLDGSVLVGTWKGNHVRWTCEAA